MKTCKGCAHCYTIYMQCAWRYYKTRTYYCADREELLTHFTPCKKWRGKVRDFDVSPERLTAVQANIAQIIQLLG